MNDKMELTQYFKCQTDICYCSQLYGDFVEEHGSKVLMLFAEIYAYMVQEFGLSIAPNLIIQYENSDMFKKWFWKVKHQLGFELFGDPDFDDIGTWIGKGFFLKIVMSIVVYNRVFFEECSPGFSFDKILQRTVVRQKELLEQLKKSNSFTPAGKKAIEMFDNGYRLLNEIVYLDANDHNFISNNIIK